MRKIILPLLCGSLLLFSCNSEESETVETVVEEDSIPVNESAELNPTFGTDLYVWELDPESKTKKRNPLYSERLLNADSLIKGLNAKFPEIKMEKIKQSRDTLYTRIPNSQYLTQQFGSSGPEFYISQVVVNLTSIPGINYVNLAFEPGDHAQPGVYNKKTVEDFRTVE